MTESPQFTASDDLRGAAFLDADLRGARFVGSDLSGVVMRGVDVDGADVDAPWLLDGRGSFVVNGVDVAPLVDAELDRRFPGRSARRAPDPEGLRRAWADLETAWAAAVDRAATMPPGTTDVSVDGEWSFAQTLRHLVLATDLWLGQAVLSEPDPFHPLGLRHTAADVGAAESAGPPPFEEVLAARADRVAKVRGVLAGVTAEQLAEPRPNPHDPAGEETVLSCLHVVLEEEWEHLRYAVRDLDVLAARTTTAPPG